MTASARVLATLLFLVLLAPASAAGSGGAGVQPDGTILVLDRIESGTSAKDVVGAFAPDGTPDSSYGGDGAVWFWTRARPTLGVLPDGRARVLTSAEYCQPAGGEEICSEYFLLERLDAAGNQEESVATWGDAPSGYLSSAALAVGPGGLFQLSPDFQAVTRVGVDGPPLLAETEFSEAGRDLSDVVAAGDGAVVYGRDHVGRLDAALAPVEAFGEDGWIVPPLPVQAAAVDGDRLLLVGDGEVARLLTDGSLDPDFGDGGVAALPVAGATRAIAVAPDGTVTTGATKDGDFVVQRLTPAGEPDTGFGGDGAAVVDFDASDELKDLVLLEDGAVVATGATNVAEGDRRFALARLDAAGELDAGFGDGGKTVATADVKPPVITLDEAPAEGSVVDAESVRIAVSTDEPASLRCNGLDCDEAVVLENLTSGVNVLRVRATDLAGHVGQLDTYFFVAPRTRLVTGPAAKTSETSASFTWVSANLDTSPHARPPAYRCRLDGGEWSTCKSGHDLTGLADGEHVFEVQQFVERFGPERVYEVEPERWTWTVDTTPEEPVKPTPPGGGGGPGSGAPLVPEPPVFVPPTLEQQRAAARAGLKTSVKRPGRLRRARAVSLDVGSAVKASVRVTGSVRMAGRRRAIALRPFSGAVDAGRSVRAKLRLSKAARALLRRRGGPRTVVVRLKVTLADSGGRSLATRSIRVRARR